jgi:DNA-binding transcriptional ArsR family regulator
MKDKRPGIARSRPRLPKVADVQPHLGKAVALLKALSNEPRLLVVCCLVEGDRSVGELNARVPISQSALSQHLAVLRAAGIVVTRRQAQSVYYGLAEGPALKLLEALHDAYCARLTPARLRQTARSVPEILLKKRAKRPVQRPQASK